MAFIVQKPKGASVHDITILYPMGTATINTFRRSKKKAETSVYLTRNSPIKQLFESALKRRSNFGLKS